MIKEEVSDAQLVDFSADVVQTNEGSDREEQTSKIDTLIKDDYSLIDDVEVTLSAYLGDAKIPIGELFSLTEGSVVTLSTKLGEPVVLFLKNKAVATGQIVAVGESFGVEISEII